MNRRSSTYKPKIVTPKCVTNLTGAKRMGAETHQLVLDAEQTRKHASASCVRCWHPNSPFETNCLLILQDRAKRILLKTLHFSKLPKHYRDVPAAHPPVGIFSFMRAASLRSVTALSRNALIRLDAKFSDHRCSHKSTRNLGLFRISSEYSSACSGKLQTRRKTHEGGDEGQEWDTLDEWVFKLHSAYSCFLHHFLVMWVCSTKHLSAPNCHCNL